MYFTDHSDGTECASCCDAFRKSWFPSLFEFVSFVVVGVDRNRGAGWTNSFCRFVWSENVSTKWCQSRKVQSESGGVLTYHCWGVRGTKVTVFFLGSLMESSLRYWTRQSLVCLKNHRQPILPLHVTKERATEPAPATKHPLQRIRAHLGPLFFRSTKALEGTLVTFTPAQ